MSESLFGNTEYVGILLGISGGEGDGFRILIFQIDLEFAKKTSDISTDHGIEQEICLKDL